MTILLKKMSSFWQFFYIQLAIFQRVRCGCIHLDCHVFKRGPLVHHKGQVVEFVEGFVCGRHLDDRRVFLSKELLCVVQNQGLAGGIVKHCGGHSESDISKHMKKTNKQTNTNKHRHKKHTKKKGAVKI